MGFCCVSSDLRCRHPHPPPPPPSICPAPPRLVPPHAASSPVRPHPAQHPHPHTHAPPLMLRHAQGPALLAYNDALFSPSDFHNISRIGQDSKAARPTAIGRFGLGFNAVYHFTDLPCFVRWARVGAGGGGAGAACAWAGRRCRALMREGSMSVFTTSRTCPARLAACWVVCRTRPRPPPSRPPRCPCVRAQKHASPKPLNPEPLNPYTLLLQRRLLRHV